MKAELNSHVRHASSLLKALSNESRLLILCILNNRGERNVSQLERLVGLSQSALSQHLAKLRQEGLVKTRRDAQTIFYSTDTPEVKKILDTLCGIYCASSNEEKAA